MTRESRRWAAADRDVVDPSTGRRNHQKNPRRVYLVDTDSGYVFERIDDGFSSVGGDITPHVRRQQIEGALKKKRPDGFPAFVLRDPLDALYPGDPLASAPVLDKAMGKKIAERAERRAARLNETAAIVQRQREADIGRAVMAQALKTPDASIIQTPSVARPREGRNG